MIDTEVARTFDRRSALFLTGGAVLTSFLILRMLQMQVFEYKNYLKKSENNSFRIQNIMAKRGSILSESGTVISRDAPIYRIYLIPEEAEDIHYVVDTVEKELKLRKNTVERIWKNIKKQAPFQPVLITENSNWQVYLLKTFPEFILEMVFHVYTKWDRLGRKFLVMLARHKILFQIHHFIQLG